MALTIIASPVFAQDYYDADYIRNEDYIYKDYIKTVLLFRAPNELSKPIIDITRGDKLILSFDDMDADVKNYNYTVIHCDAYWNESDIMTMEYINGFDEDNINDYARSFNTIQPYTNYRLKFPTGHMRLMISGNYILKVFINDDADENVVFTRRFMVVDPPTVDVVAWVAKTTNLDDRYTKQQVSFKIHHSNYNIPNAYRDVHVTVRQNNRWDNAVTNISPRLVTSNVLEYTLDERILFQAGNEFRHLDLKTVKYRTDRMQSLEYTHEGYHVYVLPDMPKNRKEYLSDEDINGRRLISSNDSYARYIGSEYAWVHFIIPHNQPLANGNFYIFGELTNWQYSAENKMTYDYDLRAYLVSLYLKQGYYNYAYNFLQDGTRIGDFSPIEGSHWETENEYGIYVYHRRLGEYYDRLISVTFINSHR